MFLYCLLLVYIYTMQKDNNMKNIYNQLEKGDVLNYVGEHFTGYDPLFSKVYFNTYHGPLYISVFYRGVMILVKDKDVSLAN